MARFFRAAVIGALILALPGCVTTPLPPRAAAQPPRGAASAPASQASSIEMAKPAVQDADASRLYYGTGATVKPPPVAPARASAGGPGVLLNFEGADLREVVRNILGDILNESYTIDPSVGGQVTIRTSSGIPRDALPATLETLLRMNGATMVKEDGIYKIVPQAAAVRGNVTPQLGGMQRALPPGFSVQIVPLRFIGVREMLRILEPFAKDAQAIRGDDLRNMLVLSGTERELRHLLDTIDMFDVDWMSGMSVGLFTLQSADVKSVMADLTKAIGDPNLSALTGILRIIPIERLNAILVITPQASYLAEAKKWVERLDRSGMDSGGVRFYVYNLQYQRSEKIGPLLQQAFTGRTTQAAGPTAPTVAPGTPAGTIVTPPAFQPGMQVTPAPGTTTTTTTTTAGAAAALAAAQRLAGGDGSGVVRNLQVVADKDNNTLLIVATPAEYSIIEQALNKLDVAQRQVLMEVTMAEVKLTDNLSIGVEALFRSLAPSGRGSAGSFNVTPAFNPADSTRTTGLGVPSAANFAYIINSAKYPGGIQAVLNLMDSYGNTKVLANPQLAALDNQKATIKVGDRIPICTSTLLNGTVNTNVQTTSQYIDTGTLFQVTPHINANGIVTLDVQAEVSIPGPLSGTCDQPPTINTRSVQTLLAVPTGQTMVLGGLISDTRIGGTEGIPFLSRIPVIGGLFGSQNLNVTRVELVIFITPRVFESESGAAEIIEDLRRRMERLDFAFPVTSQTPELTGADKAKRAFHEMFPAMTPMQRGTFFNAPTPPEAAPPSVNTEQSAPATPPSASPAPSVPASPASAAPPPTAPAAPPSTAPVQR